MEPWIVPGYHNPLVSTMDNPIANPPKASKTESSGDAHSAVLPPVQPSSRHAADQAVIRLASIVESSDDAIIGKDLDGIITSWNHGAEKIFGFTEGEMLGTSIRRLIPTDRQDEEVQILARIVGGAGVKHFETLRLHRDGHLIPVSITASPIKDAAGHLVGVSKVARDITEHVHEVEKLRDSEEKFRQMAENITDAFWMTSPDMQQTLYVSPAFELIWGRSVASVFARPNEWAEAILPEDRDRVFATFARLKADAPSVSLEFRIARPDGSVRWIFCRGFQIRDAAGHVVRLLGISSDITERVLAEDKLRESERRFTDMLLNLQLIAVMIDRESRITFCNDYLLKLTGWQRPEVIGRDWFAIFAPPEKKAVKDAFAALLANQPAALHHENEILTRSGARLRIAWNNSVLRSPEGAIIGIASIGEDITEQKLAEAARGRLIAILESTTDLVSISDPAGNFLYLNRAGRNLLGVGLHEDITSLAANDFIPNTDTNLMLTEGIRTAISTGIWSGETVLANRRGQQFPISQVLLAHKSAEGKLEYFSSIMRDITQRKHATEELEAANWQLLRANVAKDRLLTVTTHDLRGPLTAVRGLADYLRDGTLGPVNEKQVETLNYLTGSVETMLALVNDLLDVTNSGDGMKLTCNPVDISLLLRWAGRVYSPVAAQKHFTIKLDFPDSGLEVRGDEIHLKRVLENLVMNAIKFSTPGTQITLGARRTEDGVAVWVDDEGPGVPIEEQGKLFKDYGRTSIRPTGGESSTGLGLAICKRIVSAHGGVITMQNRPTGGAHFEFTIPRLAKLAGAETQAA